MFRRRRSSDETFDRVVALVERAKADLVSAVPSPRGAPGRPVADALVAFEDGLRRAAAAVEGWPAPPGAEDVRARCAAAIDDALGRGERLRMEAPSLDYESLVTVLGDLIAPLDAFADAESAARQSTRGRWPDSSSGTS